MLLKDPLKFLVHKPFLVVKISKEITSNNLHYLKFQVQFQDPILLRIAKVEDSSYGHILTQDCINLNLVSTPAVYWQPSLLTDSLSLEAVYLQGKYRSSDIHRSHARDIGELQFMYTSLINFFRKVKYNSKWCNPFRNESVYMITSYNSTTIYL